MVIYGTLVISVSSVIMGSLYQACSPLRYIGRHRDNDESSSQGSEEDLEITTWIERVRSVQSR